MGGVTKMARVQEAAVWAVNRALDSSGARAGLAKDGLSVSLSACPEAPWFCDSVRLQSAVRSRQD